MSKNCDHNDFTAAVEVQHLIDVMKWVLEIQVTCQQCGMMFRFLGLPQGVDLDGAAASVDGTEARLSIAPAKWAESGQVH